MPKAPISENQRETVAFLSDPASYHPKPAHVGRIDTHGAHVFIGGTDVFKIKRAIRYPYMDFSTLEQRQAACARELEINTPNAPSIYKRLTAITREADGRLAFDGCGPIVEWAVHMARFPQKAVLDRLIVKEPLTERIAKALADTVFESHTRAAVNTHPARSSSIESIAENILAVLPTLFAVCDQPTITALARRLTGLIHDVQPLLERRARAGYVRRCHGDLHLGNIVLLDGKPTLFDAIEFDEALATTDTLYDLAFLLMDLDKRGHRATANVVFNRYLWRSRSLSDVKALAALPVFLALRASIRAMVGAQRTALADGTDAEARSYLAHSLDYLRTAEPALVVVGGLSGSGKSTLATALAPSIGRAPGALHLRSDLERKALFDAEEFANLPSTAYGEDATAKVYAQILQKAEIALRAGHSVIADAVHAHASERAAMGLLAKQTGARLHAFWLDAPPKVLLDRVGHRINDASDATPQVVERQLSYDLGHLEWTRLDASGPFDETLRTALSHLHASMTHYDNAKS